MHSDCAYVISCKSSERTFPCVVKSVDFERCICSRLISQLINRNIYFRDGDTDRLCVFDQSSEAFEHINEIAGTRVFVEQQENDEEVIRNNTLIISSVQGARSAFPRGMKNSRSNLRSVIYRLDNRLR